MNSFFEKFDSLGVHYFGDEFMIDKFLFGAAVFCLSSASFAGEAKMTMCLENKSALFTTQISRAIEITSLDKATLMKVDKLTSKCHNNVSLGLSTYATDACKQALELVGIN